MPCHRCFSSFLAPETGCYGWTDNIERVLRATTWAVENINITERNSVVAEIALWPEANRILTSRAHSQATDVSAVTQSWKLGNPITLCSRKVLKFGVRSLIRADVYVYFVWNVPMSAAWRRRSYDSAAFLLHVYWFAESLSRLFLCTCRHMA